MLFIFLPIVETFRDKTCFISIIICVFVAIREISLYIFTLWCTLCYLVTWTFVVDWDTIFLAQAKYNNHKYIYIYVHVHFICLQTMIFLQITRGVVRYFEKKTNIYIYMYTNRAFEKLLLHVSLSLSHYLSISLFMYYVK